MAAFDLSVLTLGEIAHMEKLTGLPVTVMMDEDQPKGTALAAMALIHGRRNGRPAMTWADAQGLTFEQAHELLGIATDAEADPAPAPPPATELPEAAPAPATPVAAPFVPTPAA